MSIQLRIVDKPERARNTEVGDMWRWPAKDWPDRECWVVHLPNDCFWNTTQRATTDGQPWDVSGEPPNITVTPSIFYYPDRWHGFITNGELVDA